MSFLPGTFSPTLHIACQTHNLGLVSPSLVFFWVHTALLPHSLCRAPPLTFIQSVLLYWSSSRCPRSTVSPESSKQFCT